MWLLRGRALPAHSFKRAGAGVLMLMLMRLVRSALAGDDRGRRRLRVLDRLLRIPGKQLSIVLLIRRLEFYERSG